MFSNNPSVFHIVDLNSWWYNSYTSFLELNYHGMFINDGYSIHWYESCLFTHVSIIPFLSSLYLNACFAFVRNHVVVLIFSIQIPLLAWVRILHVHRYHNDKIIQRLTWVQIVLRFYGYNHSSISKFPQQFKETEMCIPCLIFYHQYKLLYTYNVNRNNTYIHFV